jgi:hypothetical protein
MIALLPNEFGIVLLAATGVGAVAAFLSALGAGRIYERVGRGYLDVGATDPVAKAGGEALELREPLELTEVREMLDATDSLRRARGLRSRAGQERIAELLEELARK